ncbi:MAG: LicD family protein [Eubacteriales bacterium]|nr:LicD family protein [Eubacteriales bacterium]
MKLTTNDLFKEIANANSGYDLICPEGETLKRYQQVVLSITRDVIEVAEEEHVRYHITGGSALGAVRHQGFIPWDDDMDIDMLGEDFDRFITAFRRKYGDKYWIHTCDSKNYGGVASKIRLKGTVSRGREDMHTDECGISIDIFRIENVPNNPVIRRIHGTICLGMGYLLSCRNFYRNRDFLMKIAPSKEARKLFRMKIRIGRLLAWRSADRWAQRTQAWYSMCRNNHSRYVSVPSGRNHYFGEIYKREDFVETTTAEFEGNRWPVPKAIDAYLTHMYGDYRKIPPEDKREKHMLFELRFPDD